MAVPVTATYTDAAGTAQSGTVEFRPVVAAANGTDIITRTAVVATLDGSGAISQSLVGSDDASWGDYTEVKYEITEKIDGLAQRVYTAALTGASIDLSTVQPT